MGAIKEPIYKEAEPFEHKKYVGPDVPLSYPQIWRGKSCYGFDNVPTPKKRNKSKIKNK